MHLDRGSQRALHRGAGYRTFEAGDRHRRRQALGAALGARSLGVAAVAARIARDCAQALGALGVAHVIDQGPGAVESGGAQEVGPPLHHVARRIAHRAADALDAGVHGLTLGAVGAHAGKWLVAGLLALKAPEGPRPFVEEGAHVGGQVLDHRQIGQRRDLQHAVVAYHLGHMGAAAPTRLAIDRHGAGAAHAHAASETVGQGGIEHALHVRHHIEHGLVVLAWHVVVDEAAAVFGASAAPDLDLQGGVAHVAAYMDCASSAR